MSSTIATLRHIETVVQSHRTNTRYVDGYRTLILLLSDAVGCYETAVEIADCMTVSTQFVEDMCDVSVQNQFSVCLDEIRQTAIELVGSNYYHDSFIRTLKDLKTG